MVHKSTMILAGASGSVTDVSLSLSDGITGSVTSPTTTPVINLGLGDITPDSIVTGNINGTWIGTAIAGQYGGTGVANTGLTINLASGAVGKVLASDSSGNATWAALSGIGVTSIAGTANRITASAATGAVTLDIAATYVGQSSITTLGTIGTGTWQGTKISEVYGGTNQATYTTGDTLYASAANTLSKLAGNTTAAIQYLSQTGTGSASAAPIWATISGGDITGAALSKADDTNVTLALTGTPATCLLRAATITAGWTGQLSLARGGTNANLTASNGGIFYSTASAGAILAGTATANKMLLSGSSTTPSWSTSTIPTSAGATAGKVLASDGTNYVLSSFAFPTSVGATGTILRSDGTNWAATTSTYPNTNAINTLLYASSANVMAALATANSSVLITSSGGVPSLSSTLPSVGILTAPASNASLTIDHSSKLYGLQISGSLNASLNPIVINLNSALAPVTGGSTMFGIYNNNDYRVPNGQTTNAVAAYYTAWNTASNLGTITNFYGYFYDTATSFTGTVTNAYGAHFKNPASGATNRIALYADNFVIGNSYITVTPPSSGGIIEGRLGIGTNSNTAVRLRVAGVNGGDIAAVLLTGAVNTDDSTAAYGFVSNMSITANNTSRNLAGLFVTNTYTPTSTNTVDNVYGIYSAPTVTVGSGTVTSAYAGYFVTPSGGTNKAALFATNIAIGSYTGTTPPTNGAIISGQVGIGASSVSASALLELTSTTQGLRFPNMTTTQKNAISSPATGLTVFDTTLSNLYIYDSAAWRPASVPVPGSTGTILRSNGTSWVATTATYPTTTTANQLLYSSATNTVGGLSSANSSVLVTDSGGVPSLSTTLPEGLGVGVAPDSGTTLTVGATRRSGILLTGTNTVANANSINLNQTLNCATGGVANYGVLSNNQYIAPTGQTITSVYGFFTQCNASSNVGTITNFYGYYFGNAGSIAGTVTNAYGGYFSNPPSGATNRTALFASNLVIGDSYAGTTPPSDGAIIKGRVGIGASSNTFSRLSLTATTGDSAHLLCVGSVTTDDSAAVYGILVNSTFSPAANSRNAYGLYLAGTYIPTSTNTINNVYGIYSAPSAAAGGGTITNAYSGYFVNPGAGTNRASLYTDDLSVGYTGVSPMSSGAIISGAVAIGRSSALSSTYLSIAPTASTAIGLQVNATITAANAAAIVANNTFSPTLDSSLNVGVYGVSAFNAASAKTIDLAAHYYAYSNSGSNAGTITNFYGYFFDSAGSLTGVTNAYGGYFNNPPSGATNRVALYAANLAIGSYTGTAPPASGMIMSGALGVGTNSPNAAALIDMVSTTKGLKLPNMTTAQKVAIANVAGLMVFDTNLSKACVNSGAGWETITSI